jgi:protein TonB
MNPDLPLLPRGGLGARGAVVLAGAAMLLAACAQKAQPPAAAPAPAPTPAPAPAAAPQGAPSQANSVNGYKTEVARRVYETSAAQVFTGQPPPLLRSIVVVSVVIDENGQLVSARVYRDNGDVEMRNAALASLKRATPLPKPTRAVLKGRQVEYLESWLFRRDGKFQVRSLAELQASE